MRHRLTFSALVCGVALAPGCAEILGTDFGDYVASRPDGGPAPPDNDGGADGADASEEAGGFPTSAAGAGGMAGASGFPASTGGSPPGNGGSMATGGAPGAGGETGSGGAVESGGASGAGGAFSNGGMPGAGGAFSNGGAPGAGGAFSSGGAPGSGGSASGGSPGSGGAPGTGGSFSAGGAPSAGGAGPGGCGNGVVNAGEQCDDGNGLRLDGCDLACRYELFLRVDSMVLQTTAAPSWCSRTTNRFGAQALRTVVSYANSDLSAGISAGTTNNVLLIPDLADPSGGDMPSMAVGLAPGAPDPARGAWPGGSPIDWSFLLDGSSLDGQNLPSRQFPASISGRLLTAGTGGAFLQVSSGGSLHRVELIDLALQGSIGPTTSTPLPPPAAAQIAANLQVMETLTGDGGNQGLCGTLTVESLAKLPMSSSFTTVSGGCSASCAGSRQYTYCGANQPVGPSCNSLLDVLVGGCSVSVPIFGCTPQVPPTLPDVNHGGTVALTLGANSKVPAAQTTGNQSGYSAYYKVRAKRAHATGRL